MPFTPSHALAILPFVRTPLPVAALVVGSMAPDLPYFAPLGVSREFSHSLLGLVSVDLVISLAALALWFAVLRSPLLDYSPGWLRRRMPRSRGLWGSAVPGRPAAISLGWLLAALALGMVTHILWDAVTHAGLAPVLELELGPYELHTWLHLASSLLGAAGIALWLRGWVRRTPASAPRPAVSVVGPRERWLTWTALGLLIVVASGAMLAAQLEPGPSDRLFDSARVAMGVTFAAVVVLAVLWRLRARQAAQASTTKS